MSWVHGWLCNPSYWEIKLWGWLKDRNSDRSKNRQIKPLRPCSILHDCTACVMVWGKCQGMVSYKWFQKWALVLADLAMGIDLASLQIPPTPYQLQTNVRVILIYWKISNSFILFIQVLTYSNDYLMYHSYFISFQKLSSWFWEWKFRIELISKCLLQSTFFRRLILISNIKGTLIHFSSMCFPMGSIHLLVWPPSCWVFYKLLLWLC